MGATDTEARIVLQPAQHAPRYRVGHIGDDAQLVRLEAFSHGVSPVHRGSLFAGHKAYEASGITLDPRITLSRVSNGTPCTMLVAAMSSSAGSLPKSRRVEARATARSIGQTCKRAQHPRHVPVVKLHVDSTELNQLGQLPQDDGRYRPLVSGQQYLLGWPKLAADRVDEDVRVKIEHLRPIGYRS